MSHFKVKMHQIRFPASVRSFVHSFVRPSLIWSLTLSALFVLHIIIVVVVVAVII